MEKKISSTAIGLIIALIFLIFMIGIVLGVLIEKKDKELIIHFDFDDTNTSEISEDNKYPFMPKEYSDYIVTLSEELELDSDLVAAIILKENPGFDPDATHKNDNGTLDIGLGQLNSAYIWSTFKSRYWKFDFELNPYNWKQNLYIVMCHIKYLDNTLKNQDCVIQAYNCGEYNVMNNTVPDITKNYYLPSVKNNLRLIKANNVEINNVHE